MSIFKKKKPVKFFEDDPVDKRFKTLDGLVSECMTKASCNRLKEATDHIFTARQLLRGIKTDDDSINDLSKYMLHEKDGEA